MKRLFTLFACISVLSLVAGCAATPDQAATSQAALAATEAAKPQETSAPPASPTSVPTATLDPTPTSPPTPTNTPVLPTETPPPPPTPTPLPPTPTFTSVPPTPGPTRTPGPRVKGHAGVNALLLLPDGYGANYYLNKDDMELFGWNVTIGGVRWNASPCGAFAQPHGCSPVRADVRIREIPDISEYDVVVIMPSTLLAFGGGGAYNDLLESEETLALLAAAENQGSVLFAPCGGVGVLAAAGVIDGRTVTGEAGYKGEYTAAGATFIGNRPPPIVDGNIVTAVRGLYYHVQINQAIATALENTTIGGEPAGETETQVQVADQEGALWTRTYGGSYAEGARSVRETSDGGLILAGYTYSFGAGNSDLYLLKTDAGGGVLWTQTFGGPGWEYGESVVETSDGGYLVTGYTTSEGAGGRDVYLVKTDAQGEEIWTRTYGGPGLDMGMSVLETRDEAYLVAGYTESFGAGESDAYLIKIDTEGNELWSATYGDTGPEMGHAVDETDDGGFVVAGASGSYSDNSDVYLLKLDSDGNEVWTTTISNPTAHLNYDWGNAVQAARDGGFVVAGNSDLEDDVMDLFLVKTNAQGTTEWADVFGGRFYDYGSSVCETSDGGFVVSGATKAAGTGQNDVYVRKVDAEGNEVWTRTFGTSEGSEWGTAVTRTSDGGVLIAGHTDSYGAGAYDVWLIKVQGEADQ